MAFNNNLYGSLCIFICSNCLSFLMFLLNGPKKRMMTDNEMLDTLSQPLYEMFDSFMYDVLYNFLRSL